MREAGVEWVRSRAAAPRRRLGIGGASALAGGTLLLLSWVYVWMEQRGSLLSSENLQFAVEFLRELVGRGAEKPAYLDPESWRRALRLSYETLAMSVLAAGFAAIGTLITVIPAARTAADGTLTLSRGWLPRLVFLALRGAYVVSRSVPELLWAMLIVFVFTPGILPGALALGLHNFGILGKLCAEVVEDLDVRPARAVRACGASTPQMLLYAVLPSVLPQFLTYLFYRWEVIIRTTIVVGFVSAGGLGRQFRLSMSWFHLTDVGLLLLCYLALVFLVELIANGLRKLAR